MKISWRWLEEFLPEGVGLSPQEAARRLTDQGIEVESCEELGALHSRIVVGKVVKKVPHPNANKLSLCTVSIGTETVSVVCGAPNVSARACYPFAQIGAKLPSGTVLQKTEIRGLNSHGMLCSETELGLPRSEDGLLTLPVDSPVGLSVKDLPGIHDVCFDIAVTANRGDCLSHLGIARELYAQFPDWGRGRLDRRAEVMVTDPGWTPVSVRSDSADASLYLGRAMDGLTIGPSPFWVRRRLLNCGIRPINTLVDAGNYVLLERGHPVHVFDLSEIKGPEILVRHALPKERFCALDEKEYHLVDEDLVVSDATGGIALAGLVGGTRSQVTIKTSRVFLECAVFDPVRVRRTAKRLGIATESSYRFERGVDRHGAREVMERLGELLLAWAGGGQAKVGPIVRAGEEGQRGAAIALSLKWLARFLGTPVAASELKRVLDGLGFELGCPPNAGDPWMVKAPSYRNDIEGAADLAEEIARILGYATIPSQLPSVSIQKRETVFKSVAAKRLLAFLQAQGFYQTIHFSFTAAHKVGVTDSGDSRRLPIALSNPLSEENAELRQSLALQLLETYARGQRIVEREWKLFEYGAVFWEESGTYREEPHLAILWDGARREDWRQSTGLQVPIDFFDFKGLIEKLLALFSIPKTRWEFGLVRNPASETLFHPGKCATILLDGEPMGSLGELHPEKVKEWKLRAVARGEVARRATPFIAELRLDKFMAAQGSERHFVPYSPFPRTSRDLTVLLGEEQSYQDLAVFLHAECRANPWLSAVRLTSLYRGAPLPAGKKSLSFRLDYADQERTLTDDEVNDSYFKLIDKIKREKRVEIR